MPVTSSASDLYQAGQLSAALEAAFDDVKKHPMEIGKRAFLCELLCFNGEMERADKQIDTIITQKPDAAVTASLFRQLIRAEQDRIEVREQGRPPELLTDPTPAVEALLQASLAAREGRLADAAALVAQAEDSRPVVKGTCDDVAFEGLRELDDLTASVCEVLTSTGKYYWVPWEHIELIEFRTPEHPRDLLWRPAHMIVRGGPDGEVYLPVNYAGTMQQPDESLKLGRSTDWIGNEGEVVKGLGQRTWLIGEEDRPLLSLGTLTFVAP